MKKNQHGLKILRRFDEDIWNILANKESNHNDKENLSRIKTASFKNGRNVLNHIYEVYQNNYKYRNLLKNTKKRFFLRKNFKFVYKVVTNEKEFRRRTKNVKIKHYLNRLKLRRFYGNISRKKFKRLFKESMLNSNFLGRSFICLLESRLDVLLYRANFFKSIFTARQYILHQGIYVNGLLLYKPNFKIKLFDFVFIQETNKFYEKLKVRLHKKKIFGNFPNYLEVNYKLGCICFYKIPEVKEVPFPFFLNYKHIGYSFFK